MIKLTYIFMILLVVQITNASSITYQGVDISSLVKHLETQVITMEKTATVYNWSSNSNLDEKEIKQFAYNSSFGFWQAYGTGRSEGNMYGLGLYAAVDPVYTASYGGGGNNWLLTEMQIPPGFRMIEVNESNLADGQNFKFSKDDEEVLQKFNCPLVIYQFFEEGGDKLESKCQGLIRKIYQNILKIDGFTYSYGRTQFKECHNYDGYKAFVITDGKWMKPNLIRYYTSKTENYLEERRIIQTLFLKSKSDDKKTYNEALKAIQNYLTGHKTSNLRGSKTICSGDSCVIQVQFCADAQNCENIDLPALPRPGGPLITSREAAHNEEQKTLLWSDLENQPKATTITSWLKENMYQCQ